MLQREVMIRVRFVLAILFKVVACMFIWMVGLRNTADIKSLGSYYRSYPLLVIAHHLKRQA